MKLEDLANSVHAALTATSNTRLLDSCFPAEPCTTASTWGSSATVTQTLDAICELLAQVECPLSKMMREQGCDPKDGWVLMLPKGLLKIKQLPEYVKESEFVCYPMCVNTQFGFVTTLNIR